MRLFLLISILFFSGVLQAHPVTGHLKDQLVANSKVDVMVYFKGQPDLSEAPSILNRSDRVTFVFEKLLQTSKGNQQQVIQYLESIDKSFEAFVASNSIFIAGASHGLVEKLASFPMVRQIGADIKSSLTLPFPEIPPPSEPEPQKIGVPPHLKTIQVDKVWEELQVFGDGIIIAGQDTGYFWRHNALKSKYRGTHAQGVEHDYNWLDAVVEAPCSSGGREPCDDKDHGTHTMGTMVGDDQLGNQVGVAPNAQWIGCRNMKKGVGKVSTYLRCFDFFLAPYPVGGDVEKDGRPELAPHIVNNSWSCPVDEGCSGEEFYGLVKAFKAAGIMLVAAAGNNGPNCGSISDQPGRFAGDLIAVGAWNSFLNEIAFFSGLGPSSLEGRLAPNLVAPGAFVKSSLASAVDAYDDKAGTSMASPQVAGVVALLWSHRPELIGQIDLTIDRLQRSATPMKAKTSCPGFPGSATPNAVYGHGMLNAYKALTIN